VWAGAGARGHGLIDLARWMAEAPAELAGLAGRKGGIGPGRDADLVVWRPEAERRVEPDSLKQRHRLTPYAGRLLPGIVDATYLRGELIYERGAAVGPPRGELLTCTTPAPTTST
jgi:allantoinase